MNQEYVYIQRNYYVGFRHTSEGFYQFLQHVIFAILVIYVITNAQDRNRSIIQNGYKMKWHQVGERLMQLRLTVGIFTSQCFLCEAYVKSSDKFEERQLARFKTYLQLIKQGNYNIRGRLT